MLRNYPTVSIGHYIYTQNILSIVITFGRKLMKVPCSVDLLEKLRKNAHLNKHSHFEASKRNGFYNGFIGLPIIVINLILGSVYVSECNASQPAIAWGMATVALLGASLGAIQTFFNFKKTFESHRSIANQYLAIARECDIAIANYCDDTHTDSNKLLLSLQDLNSTYIQVNKDAESLPTSNRDFQKSLGIQKQKEKAEQSILDSYLRGLKAEAS